ncbi:aminoglycoside 3-N-acetyltransferase [Halogranum amylolyticum]|uniref:Aminoglycoside 3-N-acetyltransferase n=1 Tax=Halogranum amylolyticum TaxID=660520 RepID=A0A1H8SSG9_9EURY|nr:AAC(3) family N-acetyltransferase [Halogranum amylolyticum]SEO81591.1 aminoglycoside 3-N-acetyltransferase [Halogranum amylolyticum]
MTDDPNDGDEREGHRRLMEMVDEPVTTDSLVADLRGLGVERGETLLVHSSLSSLGWVSGGAPAATDALLEAVGEEGTLVTPTHTPQCSDPDEWENPPVPDGWVETLRETMTPYRSEITPTWAMGAIPECFRDYPETRRSNHPTYSFAAQGPTAADVIEDHPIDDSLGENSPLGRLYDLDAQVLMLGTGHETNTSLHLAEYRAEYAKEYRTKGAPALVDGERRWLTYEDLEIDSEDFPEIGEAFEAAVGLVEGEVGTATAKLVDQRSLVDFGVEWMAENRQ